MDRRSTTLNATPQTVPLWLRFLRQIVQEARPSIRDAVVATLTAAFALLLQIYQGGLSWSLSTQNAVRVQFPIVAFFAVFLVLDVGKATRSLLREVQTESQIRYNPFPSLVLPNNEVFLVATKDNAFRKRIALIGLVAAIMLMLCGVCMISWRAAYWSFEPPHVSEIAALPKDDSTAPVPPSSMPTPGPVKTQRFKSVPKASTKKPCAADDRLLGLC